jgi:hypothetical protein
MTPETIKYFEEQNIQVHFDTLGKTKALKAAYIDATQKLVDANPTKRSEMVKHACYSQFYSMKQREKLTGFEQFAELDKQYRIENKEYIGENIFRMSNLVDKSHSSGIILPYKTQLGISYEEYNKPILLYLSGGLDSELVARSLIEFGIKFTPVIFNWGNKKGEIVNSNDTQYAVDFCNEFQLTPIVKTVNIDELWISAEFKRLGKSIRILSPQLTTHAYMVELMNSEKPDHIHLLGGEVRYKSNFDEVKTDGFVMPNLVYVTKAMPSSVGTMYATSRTRAFTQLNQINVSAYISVPTVNSSSITYGGAMNFYDNTSGSPSLMQSSSPLISNDANFCRSGYSTSGSRTYTYDGNQPTFGPGSYGNWSYHSDTGMTKTYPAGSFPSAGTYGLFSGNFHLRNENLAEMAIVQSCSFNISIVLT